MARLARFGQIGDLDLKQIDQKISKWRNPLVVGIFVAALGLFGNIGVSYLQNKANESLARGEAQSVRPDC